MRTIIVPDWLDEVSTLIEIVPNSPNPICVQIAPPGTSRVDVRARSLHPNLITYAKSPEQAFDTLRPKYEREVEAESRKREALLEWPAFGTA